MSVWTSQLLTESRNAASSNLDTMSSMEIVSLMNSQDLLVVQAVHKAQFMIAGLVDAIKDRLAGGGRLFYVGAGTSGRLGALDAAECPPTFGTDPNQVQAIMAGGPLAFAQAVENAEDSQTSSVDELQKRNLSSKDFVVGIAASGRTPFVVSALEYANSLGAGSAAIFCSPGAKLATVAQHPILLEVGPEVLTGSTRLKAGTATKMVLNMLSTAVMVKLGHCYGNLMIDVSANNEKLVQRQVDMICEIAGVDQPVARELLDQAGQHVSVAVVMARRGVDAEAAMELLNAAHGSVRTVLAKAE